ncbi:BMP family ABC transporter substrate-binding protein [uncultured Sphaerochaeta sp.]|uniref:BMP family ABC transporter substrate-binding protein n=1 Tax=uncultured Sphaerochaeta sp. TaxID=886478 RepID=UPI002A0A7FF5|nr:BMP family ABC transporter substrate-binding protein [uncultured Sphaerochaeta sp.]
MHTVSIKNSIWLSFLLLFVTVGVFATGNAEKPVVNGNSLSVLVYIPGVLAGSPPYISMAEGANEFASEHQGVTVKVYEAGFNQAEWEEQLTSLVATGQYDIVLTTNPSLSDISQSIAKKFPNQKFVITDAQLAGNPQIRTYLYNQYEQSYFLGYLAGLVTTSSLPYANSDLKIGFIAAQEFPLLNKQIIPGFLDGAHRVNPNITLDFRVIGNWYDANKAAELALSMIEAKVDVFMTLSGGADQGLFKIAGEKGAYIVFPNTNSYGAVPKMVVGCGIMEQKKLTKEILGDVLQGKVAYGTATTVGIQEGYIDFISADPAYTENLPQSIRTKFDAFMADFHAGKIVYTVPSL